jgi:putative flippase GtrA
LTDGRGAAPRAHFLTRAYQRFREVIHEGAKFLIVGGTGVIVVLVGSDLLHYELGLGKFTAVTIATVVATILAFVGNRYWSFAKRQGGGAHIETILFFLLNGVGLLIQYGSIGLVTDVLGLSSRIWYTVANLVGIGIGTLFRFWSYRKWIWIRPEDQANLGGGRHRKGRADPTSNPQDRPRSELTR